MSSTPADTPMTDWTRMTRADFDDRAPLNLVEADAVGRPIPAAPDASGTEALFGEPAAERPKRRAPKPSAPPVPEPDRLF
ncbi:hypothetical protein [Streptomyces sp. NPDC046685]|uniref:hypothetical protein n=1 Tax=Streptomyces sp. NPDC046685 TaxID=3157202 RepID=UPI0033F9FAB3